VSRNKDYKAQDTV